MLTPLELHAELNRTRDALERTYHTIFNRWPTLTMTPAEIADEILRAYTRRVDPPKREDDRPLIDELL